MIILMIILIVYAIYRFHWYYNSEYHKSTKKDWPRVYNDRGSFGEYQIYKKLSNLEKQGCKFLFNCYLPLKSGDTTEVDIILLHPSGIFVIESKRYSGWIFGNENRKDWTETFAQGRGRPARKEHFYNPIWQNRVHINALKEIIGEDLPIYSLIVFSGKGLLKDIQYNASNTTIVRLNNIFDGMLKVAGRNYNKVPPILTNENIIALYSRIYPYTQVSDSLKIKHIENIKAKHGEENSTTTSHIAVISASGGALYSADDGKMKFRFKPISKSKRKHYGM